LAIAEASGEVLLEGLEPTKGETITANRVDVRSALRERMRNIINFI